MYRFIRGLIRAALAFYFTEIEVRGRENVPQGVPLLLLANHHNAMIDPLLLVAASPRPVRFIAKAPLFKIPLLGFLMRKMGCIPAYRQQDQGYAREKNAQLFQAAGEALKAGGAIGIFPEGQSHTDPTLAAFKHGASRMALEAEAQTGFTLGLRVLMVGIHFEKTRIIRGRVLVTFGPALTLESYRPPFEADPRAAVSSLTQTLQEKLSTMILEAGTQELVELADLVEGFGILEEKETGIRGEFARKKFLLERYRELKERRPEEIEEVRRWLHHYRQTLEILGVRDDQIAEDYRWGPALSFTIKNTLLLVLGAPFMAAGVLLNLLPYALCRFFVSLAPRKELDVRASVGLLSGIFLFPIWYAALAWLALRRGVDYRIWAGAVASAPLLGTLAIRWIERRRRFGQATWGLLTALRRPAIRRRLQQLRSRILRKIEALA